MDFQSQQKKFDDIKWYDSIVAGCDRCGTYDFCAVCDKEESEPCARAAYRLEAKDKIRIATIQITFGEATPIVERPEKTGEDTVEEEEMGVEVEEIVL